MASTRTIRKLSRSIIWILNLSARRTRSIRFLLALTGMKRLFPYISFHHSEKKNHFFDEKNAFILINCFRSFSFCAWKMWALLPNFSSTFSLLLLFRLFYFFRASGCDLFCSMLHVLFLSVFYCVLIQLHTTINSSCHRSGGITFVSTIHFFVFTTQIHARTKQDDTSRWGERKSSEGENEK